MDLKEKVRISLIVGFFAWGFSLGFRFDAVWDSLLMFIIATILMYYKNA